MTRLTTKDSIMGRKHDIKCGCASVWKTKLKNYRYELIEDVVDKLGELEDIEEELGIDLVTFHKAIKNGVYYKVINKSSMNYRKIFFDRYVLWGWNQNSDGTYFAMMQSQSQTFNLKDYGKTWALTKEELENDN